MDFSVLTHGLFGQYWNVFARIDFLNSTFYSNQPINHTFLRPRVKKHHPYYEKWGYYYKFLQIDLGFQTRNLCHSRSEFLRTIRDQWTILHWISSSAFVAMVVGLSRLEPYQTNFWPSTIRTVVIATVTPSKRREGFAIFCQIAIQKHKPWFSVWYVKFVNRKCTTLRRRCCCGRVGNWSIPLYLVTTRRKNEQSCTRCVLCVLVIRYKPLTMKSIAIIIRLND